MSIPGMAIARHRDLNATQAEVITKRIRSAMGDLMMLVSKAWHGRVWLALGYQSWPDYIAEEFGHAPISLPREERGAVAVLLRKQGMSARAIGPALGVDEITVRRDLGATNVAPELDDVQVTGLDGKTYTITDRRPPGGESTPPDEPEVVQPAPLVTVTCPTCGGTGKVTQ
jgi:hypothetical protein